mgnify:CR=1 FL=1
MGIFDFFKGKTTQPINIEKEASTSEAEDDNVRNFVFERTSLPYEHRNLTVKVEKWYQHSGEFVKKGDWLCELAFIELTAGSADLAAETDGWLEVLKLPSTNNEDISNILNEGDIIFTIHKEIDSEKLLEIRKKSLQNIPFIDVDEFLDTTEIKWKSISGKKYNYNSDIFDSFILWGTPLSISTSETDYQKDWLLNKHPLIFTINNLENKDFIVFKYPASEYKLKMGSKISLIFNDKLSLHFNIASKPYAVKKNWSWESKVFETKIQLLASELEILRTKPLVKWQVLISDTDKIRGVNDSQNIQFSINNLIEDYFTLIKSHIADYTPLLDRDDIKLDHKKNDGICFLYLMKDFNTGYHKIGISNTPEYREKTLQSEKPTIEMICNKQFVTRKIAHSFEQALHKTYADKRIRGEWFNLDQKDIEELKLTLNN